MGDPIARGNSWFNVEYPGNVLTTIHQDDVVLRFGIALGRHPSALGVEHFTGDRRRGIFVTSVAVRSPVEVDRTAAIVSRVRRIVKRVPDERVEHVGSERNPVLTSHHGR
jgi:hypothetical protein